MGSDDGGGFGFGSTRRAEIKGGGVACAVGSSLPRGIGQDQFEALIPFKPRFKFALLKRGECDSRIETERALLEINSASPE